jgi:hypothetical protein
VRQAMQIAELYLPPGERVTSSIRRHDIRIYELVWALKGFALLQSIS